MSAVTDSDVAISIGKSSFIAGPDPAIQPVSNQPITGLDYPVEPGNDDGLRFVMPVPDPVLLMTI